MATRYVCGFMFDQQYRQVLMIRKKRGPDNVIGKLNGVGGKIEGSETPSEAMNREFLEEAGEQFDTRIDPLGWWRNYLNLFGGKGEDLWVVHFFRAFGSWPPGWTDPTDEELHVVALTSLSLLDPVPNLRWIVPMALDFSLSHPVVVSERRFE